MKRMLWVPMLLLLAACARTDVSGTWQGTLTKENGKSLPVELALTQKGTVVEGTLGFITIGGKIAVRGSAEKEKLGFASDPHGGFYINFTGKVSGASLSGPADVVMQTPDIGKQEQKMQLTVTRK